MQRDFNREDLKRVNDRGDYRLKRIKFVVITCMIVTLVILFFYIFLWPSVAL